MRVPSDRAAVRPLPLLLAATLGLAACGDDGNGSDPEPSIDTGVDVSEDSSQSDAEPDTVIETDASEEDTAPTEDVEEDVVIPTGPLSCDGSATDTVVPGSLTTLEVPVEGGAVNLYLDFLGREVASSTDVSVACGGESFVPEGYTALSPVFDVSAATPRFDRRYFVTIPFQRDALPEGARPSSIRVFWRRPSDGRVSQPVVANVQENMVRGTLRFETELVGGFQVAVANDAGTEYQREFSFRAIGGVSMGASGASMIGARHPELFDIIAPLGGPTDWIYLQQYIRVGGMGGFNPAPDFGRGPLFEATQEYEHPMAYDEWYFPTGEGTGGSFDRGSYAQIFLDLMMTFGNMVTYNDQSPYAAPGLPLDQLQLLDADRCNFTEGCGTNEGVFTIESGYYDDEYNPDGSLPVISFCDGYGSRDESIEFDRACDISPEDGRPDETNEGLYDSPCQQRRPVDITFAVDVNGNGIRDTGEPVIRNFFEPYEDVGTDGLASADEEGYEPTTNPDPAGDDYDYVTNPFGTEGNWLYDEGEPYDDFGLDGVDGTAQLSDGGYDYGEGNGVFDYNPNLGALLSERNPRSLIQDDDFPLRDTTWFVDAGIRDLFNFGVGANQFVGTLHGTGENVRVYDQFYSLEDLPYEDRRDYNFAQVDFEDLGDHVYLRYGDQEADGEDICYGDGKHVGTVDQIANRLLTMLGFITNRFPDGETTVVPAPYPQSGGTFFVESPSYGGTIRYSIAFPPGVEVTQCTDGRDNDGDGLNDGDDPDCAHAFDLSEGGDDPADLCSDGIDNDADGLADSSDPDCADDSTSEWPSDFALLDATYPVIFVLHGYGQTPEDLQVSALPFTGFMAQGDWPKAIIVFPDGYCGNIEVRQCDDGVDNDGDGLVDGEDDGCDASGRRSESGESLSYCNDGVDNDRDGLTDLEDGGCRNEGWDSEANCIRGTFYSDHVSYPDGTTPGPPYEEMFIDLVNHLDAVYPTRAPEVFSVRR